MREVPARSALSLVAATALTAMSILLVASAAPTGVSATGDTWTQVGVDIDGEAYGERSGWSVSLSSDGSRVAVGAYRDDIQSVGEAGAVRVYDLVNGEWVLVGSSIDGQVNEEGFGYSVALSSDGSRLAVGAPLMTTESPRSHGVVRVYELVNGNWQQVGVDIVGEADEDLFGESVAISADGSRVVAGASRNDDVGLSSGHVRVYDLVNGNWQQVGTDIDGEAAGDQFGESVAMSADGSRVVAGAQYNSGSGTSAGHVRVYDLVNGDWQQVGTDIDGAVENDRFGWSVALSSDGSRVAAGGAVYPGNGHVRVYDLVNGDWQQVGADILGEAENDNLGQSIALSSDGSRLVAGARSNKGNGYDAGHVRVYDLVNDAWQQVGADIDGEAAGDKFGQSVALSSDGSRLAAGAPYNLGSGYANAGHARVFGMEQPTPTPTTPTYDVETNDGGSQIFTQSIAASLDGSVYVVGGFNSYDASPNPAVFGSTSLYNAGGTDYEGYVAKLGPDGVWDWAFRAGSTASGEDRVVDVVALDDGGAIVLIDASYDMTVSPVTGTGEFSTTGDTSILVRVNADGSFVWHKEMTGSIPDSQELSLSADQQTVVALAANNTNKNVYVEAFNTDTGASIWDRVIQKGTGEFGSTASQHLELAVNNAGTVVVSFSYYGGSYLVDNIIYDSTSMGNSATGAWHSMFAAFDITDGSTDWVAHTRLDPTNTSDHAEAQMFELEAAGDKFLAVVLVEPVNGTVNFMTGNGGVGLQYWGDYRYVVAELSDDGTWAEKAQLPTCDGSGCTLDINYMNLHAADDGSFDLWYFTDQNHSSIAWMDYLHPDDHMVVASFNADGTGEKLTSFTGGNGHRPGYQNAISSFSDGSLVIAGSLLNDLTDGAGNTVSDLPGQVFVAPLENGPWAYNTPTPPSYTISYDANGGTGAPADQTCVAGSTVTLSTTEPTRAGYTFTSWTTGGMFPPSIAPGSTRECADTALYAQWQEISGYTISYDANGGTGAPANQFCPADSTMTLSSTEPTRAGYTFLGWHTAADGSGWMSFPVSGVTLEGPSASQTGTNLFDAGTYGVLSLDNQLSAGQRLVLPSSFFADLAAAMPNDSRVRIGLKDPVWTADQDAWDSIENGARFEIGRYDSSDMYWTIHADMPNMSSYITPMSSMKGFLELDSSGDSFRLAFGEGSDAGDPAALSYEDAIANGWTYREVNLDYTATSVDVMMWGGPLSGNTTGMDSADIDWTALGIASEFISSGAEVPCEEQTLYAQWQEVSGYTISFDANGGTGAPNPLVCPVDSTATLPTTEPTRTGYTFLGWQTQTAITGITQVGPAANQTGTNLFDANDHGWIALDNTLAAGQRLILDGAFLADLAAALPEKSAVSIGMKAPNWVESWEPTQSYPYIGGQYVLLERQTDGGTDIRMSISGASTGYVSPETFANYSAFLEITDDGNTVRAGFDIDGTDDVLTTSFDNWTTDRKSFYLNNTGITSADVYAGGHEIANNQTGSAMDTTTVDWTGLTVASSLLAPGAEIPCEEQTLYAQWGQSVVDADNDGLDSTVDPDDTNPDIDGDSVLDGAEQDASCITSADCDNDGLTDDLDADDLDSDQDDDGVLDGQDPDHATTDTDGDGIPDVSEIEGCENTNDCDDDGVLDGAEQDTSCITVADCDGDGLTDPYDAADLDSDQDDDGVLDGDETAGCVTVPDCDQDGLGDALDQNDLDSDQDDDGIPDGQDPDHATTDTDGDGIPDVSEIEGCENTNDCDNDGVLDGDETAGCVTVADCDSDGLTDDLDANDLDSDQDDDGVLDGAEQDTSCITVADCDSDGLTDDLDANDLDADQDDDGVLDGAEQDASCITVADCDSDGLADALDQNDLDSDQDDDGIPDGQDPDHATTDTDGDGIPDVSEIEGCENTNDCDNDGVLDGAEEAESCITDTDCDDDGVLDGDETAGCVTVADCDSDGLTDDLDANDLDSDQDDDGIQDGDEEDASCITVADCDGDGLTDPYDAADLDSDQDDDGVLDGDETAGCVTVPDCDQDGLGDADDADDTNADQDGDGIQDGDEEDASCVAVADCDGDGLTDPYDADDLDSDQDDDGVLDGDETAGCVTVPDCDQDGLGDADDADDTNPDQDGDGIQDGDDPTPQFADSDQDGVENTAETEGCELNPDCDNDGLGDLADTDDTNPDQDDDGVQDGGEEDLSCVNTADCDQDGVNDVDETQGCALSNDCDGDTIVDAEDDNDLIRLDNDEQPVVQTSGDFAAAESQGECRSITDGADASVGTAANLDDGSVECASADGEIKIKLEPVTTRSSGSITMALQLVAGGQGVASGEGFRPFTRAEIWIASTPTLLKIVEVPASGNWVSVFDVPADLEPGNHTVQAEGLGVDGRLRAANLGVVVEAPPTPTTTTTVPSSSTTVPTPQTTVVGDGSGSSGASPTLPALPATGFADRAPLAVVLMGLALALYVYGLSTWMSDRRKKVVMAP